MGGTWWVSFHPTHRWPNRRDVLSRRIPDSASSIDEHVALACGIKPLSIMLESATSGRSRGIASRAAFRPTGLNSHRASALARLVGDSNRLAPLRAARRARLPANSPSMDLNVLLIHLIAHTIKYEDSNFAHDMASDFL